MRKYKKESREIEVLKSTICDKCNKKVKNKMLAEEINHIEVIFGYTSRKDGTVISFDICEDCFDEITKDISVKKERYL